MLHRPSPFRHMRATGRRTFLGFLAASALGLAIGPILSPAAVRAGEAPRISGPFTHENLSIWLVHGQSAPGPVPLTLPEAIEKGVVEVKETGNVNELTVENRGAEEVFIQAGDIVKGGRQDRVLSVSLTLPPKSGVLPIAAYCVEQGRWSQRAGEDAHRFASAKEMLPSREAKIALRAVKKAPPGGEVGSVEVGAGVTAGRSVEGLDMRSNRIGRPIQQQRTGERPSPSAQGEVWAKVGEIQTGLSSNLKARVQSERSATSLQLALENDKLAGAQRRFVEALQPVAEKESDVVGFVFAVNGKLNSADIYASNGLFRKLWPRLIKASATEAISAQAGDKQPDADMAKVTEFVANPPADAKAEERAPIPGMKLELRSSAKSLDSQTKASSGAVVHRNVLSY